MRRIPLLILLLAAVFLGCNSRREPKPSGEGQALAAAKTTQSPLQMALATDPQKMIEGKPFAVRVHVNDAAGKPVADAALQGVLSMSLMDHGKLPVDFTNKGGGDYEGSTKAEMAGPWDRKVSVKRGPALAEQTFTLRIDEK